MGKEDGSTGHLASHVQECSTWNNYGRSQRTVYNGARSLNGQETLHWIRASWFRRGGGGAGSSARGWAHAIPNPECLGSRADRSRRSIERLAWRRGGPTEPNSRKWGIRQAPERRRSRVAEAPRRAPHSAGRAPERPSARVRE